MERVILVRHGETEKNKRGLIHPYADEELLTERGVSQILATAKRLKDFHPDKIYSSKGRRAQQSGELIAGELSLKLRTLQGIEERNWGDFSGRTWEEVQKVLDKMTLGERYNYVPPNGESWREFETRLIKAITGVLEENKGTTIVVLSHGGAIRALMPYFLSMPRDESFKHSPHVASITIFDYQNGKFSPVAVNDTKHLK